MPCQSFPSTDPYKPSKVRVCELLGLFCQAVLAWGVKFCNKNTCVITNNDKETQLMETSNMLFKYLKLKEVSNTVVSLICGFCFFSRPVKINSKENVCWALILLTPCVHTKIQLCAADVLKLQYIGDTFPLHLFDTSQKVICMEI